MKHIRRNKRSDVFNIRCSRTEETEGERVNDDEKESLSDTSIIRGSPGSITHALVTRKIKRYNFAFT